MKLSKNIYIVDARRTAIGSPNKGMKEFSASQILSFVIADILKRNPFCESLVEEVIVGNVVSAGTGQNLARHAVLLAGLPITTAAYVVNNVCGSGLQAVICGVQKFLAEEADVLIAGATESATHNPQLIFSKEGKPEESLLKDGLFCNLAQKSMGEICEALAKTKGISREEQDRYALESHRRAVFARKEGLFQEEIVPVKTGKDCCFSCDERPRENTSLEKLARLPTAFLDKGTVTAGNASTPSDGACGFLLASEKAVLKYQLIPCAKIIGYVSIAVSPQDVFSAGIKAVEKCLKDCQVAVKDIDLFEAVEAFAAQAVYTQKALKIPAEKMNIYGGDIALGHPLGIAGSRALVTLIYALKKNSKKRGLAYVAFGAGGAIAMMIERP